MTGMLALALGIWLYRGGEGRWAVRAWKVLGLALLAVVVAMAVLSLPTPIQRFTAAPTTVAIVTFPLIWLPAVLVQAALFGHLLVLRRLRAEARTQRSSLRIPSP